MSIPIRTSPPSAQRARIDLINLSPAGGFVVAFQVGLYGGAVLASPFIFYFVAAFVFPALKMRERKYVYRGLAIGVGLFLAGVAFCYFALMPVALSAAQMYSQWLGFGAFQWRAEDYISFVCKFMLGMGLGFELPVVILDAGENRRAQLPHAVEGAAVHDCDQLVSRRGPDHARKSITQLVMFVPLQLLYEITVWIAWYWDWKERKQALHPADSA